MGNFKAYSHPHNQIYIFISYTKNPCHNFGFFSLDIHEFQIPVYSLYHVGGCYLQKIRSVYKFWSVTGVYLTIRLRARDFYAVIETIRGQT